jgi:hypothetical protein
MLELCEVQGVLQQKRYRYPGDVEEDYGPGRVFFRGPEQS